VDDFILFGIVALFGGWIGWHLRGIIMITRISQDPDRMLEVIQEIKRIRDQPEATKDASRQIKIERHGTQLYLFAKDNDEFLGQGSTLQEALDHIDKRFPGNTFKGTISKDEANALGISVK
jgi:hypothetical protein